MKSKHDEMLIMAAVQFSALGDGERLRLALSLMDGPKCVGELSEEVDAGMPTVSQRLKVLHGAGLVTKRREGKHMYYALTDQHVRELVANAMAHAHEGDE